MDATMQTVLRLHEQGIPRRTIAKRAGISLQKVRKILITAGAWSDETSKKTGSCVRTVCQFLKLQKNWV